MKSGAGRLRPFSGRVWRICDDAADPLALVASPEGRFHRGGQPALYVSLSPEGASVALATYAAPGDAPRRLWPLDLATTDLADLRDEDVRTALGVDFEDLVARWADDRAAGRPARSWRASDRLRGLGASGFLYPSRKSPEHGHLVMFSTHGLCRGGPSSLWLGPSLLF
ncbi:RES family NAD+ phosphorylase [Limimaricola sp. G21655-S1]|uniref:RES family NAD+ phosphorylase n=1 Tax=Limimaricola sp. G21655-S1 TaxID=3014768 RepID=UPI0022AE537C|nr:RES family NAD+ phosphorylase [Limimaricola sp. G21655-S1]